MGQWIHILLEKDIEKRTGVCKNCGPVRLRFRKGQPLCAIGHQKRKSNTGSRRVWIRHKKDICEQCGFIPVNKCQLDVDHIDGNKKNNDLSNLQTLCANCHRLKTFLCKDYLNTYPA